jgi:hypothetical protein
MTKRLLISLLLVALFVSCSSSGKVTTESNSRRLIFGNGGGFTGIYTIYELNEDGDISITLPDSSLQPIKKLRKKKVRELFAQADKLKITQPEFNHPGNMTWLIKYQANGIITEYKWGDANISVPDEIADLYSQLNTIVK